MATARSKKVSFKNIGRKVQLLGRLNTGVRSAKASDFDLLAGSDGRLLSELEKIDSLDDFDIFRVKEFSTLGPLQHVAAKVLTMRGFVQLFNLEVGKMKAFLGAIEKNYIDTNPYHNALHAADTTQAVHMFVNNQRNHAFEDIEVFSIIIAAIGHDVGHPGVTNGFRIFSQDEASVTYNDVSVNENFHACLLYQTLSRDGCDVLGSLSKVQDQTIRKMVVSSILATDMSQHFEHVKKLQAALKDKGDDLTKWESNELPLEMVVHAADISNVTRPFSIAERWADCVLEEFFQQGDRERKLGMPVSPLCDRRKVSKAASQPGFVDFIVKPLFIEVNAFCNVQPQLQNMEAYHFTWSERAEAEKTGSSPKGGK
jgi:hypothetical protein